MDALKWLFEASPISALFLCVAVGYAIGKVQIGKFRIGGIVGTLFAAIIIGQIGVEVDPNIKTMAFALFIYSLGYVSGPQFFGSLGRNTIDQVVLTFFNSAVVFVLIWGLAQAFGLDKGTAAGLLAGATTESASVGTAAEALASMDLPEDAVKAMQSNIAVSYAVTYLFGFTLVVFFVSVLAPKMLGVDLKQAASDYETELGKAGENFAPGQEEALREVVVRVHVVDNPNAAGMTVAAFEAQYDDHVTIQQLERQGEQCEVGPDLTLEIGDRALLIGRREWMVPGGKFLGEETTEVKGMGFVGELRDVVITNPKLANATVVEARRTLDPQLQRGVYLAALTRVGHPIDLWPHTRVQRGDVATIYGPSDTIDDAAKEIGYSLKPAEGVDYVFLGFGIITGIVIGMITVTVAGSPVALHTGGGCLISGLLFGWLSTKSPKFGSLPAATALHLRDFGLAAFVAGVGLEVGPQAWVLLKEQGVMLPLLAMTVVLVPIIISMYFARYVLKMNPVVVCGSLAGTFTCTAGLNAIVDEAKSETPVLGYTVPYAIGNVLLTLLGPVIVLTV